MKIKIEIDIDSCRQCYYKNMDMNSLICCHPLILKTMEYNYLNINYEKFPSWCPFLNEEYNK